MSQGPNETLIITPSPEIDTSLVKLTNIYDVLETTSGKSVTLENTPLCSKINPDEDSEKEL